MSSPETLAANVALWTKANAEHTDAAAARAWSREEMSWGVFNVPESSVGAIGDVAGLDVVELGCGTAYVSAWLAKRGARPVGVDPTPAQLETARRMMRETGIEFPLVEAPGESVPLPDASFDLVVSEYGASLWADPYRWIPEAARLLRPNGRLVFLTNSNLMMLCIDDKGNVGEQLRQPLFGLYRTTWPDDSSTEFHLPHGRWIHLLRETGFDVEALHELQAPEEATDPVYYDYVTAAWGRKWPDEEIWVARKR
ncbi:MAG: class I SAM-dependent methyltransferase [Actinobacteria bacterium]|nr:class I SAM-dependent methyltransferase [Actinomycetota bacterium]MBV8479835.1 class I SAM-dependent methyltransferase [Actinomycetota bacterium]